MKIDLDELDRKAKAATPSEWTTTRPPIEAKGWAIGVMVAQVYGGQRIYGTPDGGTYPAADAEHIAASSPPVVLALIARIRELEDALAVFGDDDHYRSRIVKVLEKGAVLP